MNVIAMSFPKTQTSNQTITMCHPWVRQEGDRPISNLLRQLELCLINIMAMSLDNISTDLEFKKDDKCMSSFVQTRSGQAHIQFVMAT
jgi:hypothetical protein